MMELIYPLRFLPIIQHRVWGGRRLQTLLGKDLGPGSDFGESWEIVDHGHDQSVVASGPLQGLTLRELVESQAAQLFGRHAGISRFPLLFKFLDAHDRLSVQVHPNDKQAAQLDPPDLGKTEAWYVLAADSGSLIWTGLKRGFDRESLQREVKRGTCELCLHKWEPKAGDCVLLPAGTIHALGAGIVIAEIQQSSDTTFRLFDWNRVDEKGQSRTLHIHEALGVVDYERGPVSPQSPTPTDRDGVVRLAACEKFIWDRWRILQPAALGGDDRFHIIAVVEGALEVEGDPSGRPLTTGQTLLVPAACGPCTLTPRGNATFLDAYLP
jgi:mannose-6-phosphate isomerase